ncbi:MAG: DUF2064 domain-containing protein [Gemmatimonadota bacterium]|nr:DUF2064 domain-containing protein [Gemmatimonadota bacterium]
MPARTLILFVRVAERGPLPAALRERVLSMTVALSDCEVVIAFTPDNFEADVRASLGDAFAYRAQCKGGLDDRLQAAIVDAGVSGSERMLVVDAAGPVLDADIIERAFAALESSDVVIGPTAEGRYFLIGMREPLTELFESIPWGSDRVVAATLAVAVAEGFAVAMLHEMSDSTGAGQLTESDGRS